MARRVPSCGLRWTAKGRDQVARAGTLMYILTPESEQIVGWSISRWENVGNGNYALDRRLGLRRKLAAAKQSPVTTS